MRFCSAHSSGRQGGALVVLVDAASGHTIESRQGVSALDFVACHHR